MGNVMKRVKISLRRGFTALELIIVLVVGFSIIALSASKMGQLFSASSTAAAMGSILDIFTATRSLRSSNGYGTEDLTESLIKAKMFPKSMSISGTKALNEWKGEVTVVGKDADDRIGFDITYGKVPGDACSQIAQNLLNSGSFMKIGIGGDSSEVTSESSVKDVVDKCAGSGKGGVDMIFMFSE